MTAVAKLQAETDPMQVVLRGNLNGGNCDDAATKGQRLADSAGNVYAGVDLDPWGRETARSWNSQAQPRRYTSYTRDTNDSDEAMMRRYNRWHSRFDQPDPFDGSYDVAAPQSFNRYAYVNNDPVNFIDPTGLLPAMPDATTPWLAYSQGFWGAGNLMNRTRSLGPDDLYVDSPPGLVNIYMADYWTFHYMEDGILRARFSDFSSVLEGWDWPWTGFYAQEKPHLERFFSRNPEGHDAWNRYMLECAKEKGIEIAAHTSLGAAGMPLFSKPRGSLHGASKATSLLSKIGTKIDGYIPSIPRSILPRGIMAPTLNNLTARTRHIGLAVARTIPWAAAAHLGKDFIEILQCANEKFKLNRGR